MLNLEYLLGLSSPAARGYFQAQDEGNAAAAGFFKLALMAEQIRREHFPKAGQRPTPASVRAPKGLV